MNIFLYTGKASEDGRRLQQDLVNCFPEEELRVFQNIEKFARTLHTPGEKTDVVVLLISCQKELNEFLSMKKVLLSTRIILVLPDRDMETIAKAHSLFPRFISYSDNDFSVIGAVLDKISVHSANLGNNI